MQSKSIATIGYEGADIDDFIATLQAVGIKALVDVRELPISRRKGFSKNKLAERLEGVGIRYAHVRGLGDPKAGREAARAGRMQEFRKIFRTHTKTEPYKAGLEFVATLAASEATCLVCYERDHRDCHRAIVAEDLSNIVDLSIMHLGVRKGLAQDASKGRSRKSGGARQGVTACR